MLAFEIMLSQKLSVDTTAITGSFLSDKPLSPESEEEAKRQAAFTRILSRVDAELERVRSSESGSELPDWISEDRDPYAAEYLGSIGLLESGEFSPST